jgi:hypothetical protein
LSLVNFDEPPNVVELRSPVWIWAVTAQQVLCFGSAPTGYRLDLSNSASVPDDRVALAFVFDGVE